ncbi:unnamed protein product [Plutella xylostella]|uniref:(diamondback moth) hypothetical protein n=1 Tax=Plutella xylostella TaxID=51655 RepID=A0A8S4G2V7_PLUXY|nr:unnamed protein product [Plutella xylostella]
MIRVCGGWVWGGVGVVAPAGDDGGGWLQQHLAAPVCSAAIGTTSTTIQEELPNDEEEEEHPPFHPTQDKETEEEGRSNKVNTAINIEETLQEDTANNIEELQEHKEEPLLKQLKEKTNPTEADVAGPAHGTYVFLATSECRVRTNKYERGKNCVRTRSQRKLLYLVYNIAGFMPEGRICIDPTFQESKKT